MKCYHEKKNELVTHESMETAKYKSLAQIGFRFTQNRISGWIKQGCFQREHSGKLFVLETGDCGSALLGFSPVLLLYGYSAINQLLIGYPAIHSCCYFLQAANSHLGTCHRSETTRRQSRERWAVGLS